MIKVKQLKPPKLAEPKKGGLVDSVKCGMFIEYLCDMWPNENYYCHPYGMSDEEREDNEKHNFYKD